MRRMRACVGIREKNSRGFGIISNNISMFVSRMKDVFYDLFDRDDIYVRMVDCLG